MEIYIFKPKGVCSRELKIFHEDGIIRKLEVVGGCPGNLTAISRLVEGLPMAEVAEKLNGIRCGTRATSCADQLSLALHQILAK
jgi:uncharacterized protein (TIGR03905 family)